MADEALRDAAEAELKLCTIGWNKAKNYSPAKLAPTHWGKALDLLGHISMANATVKNSAVTYLKKTTSGYTPQGAYWKLAFAELAKIMDAPAPVPPSEWATVANEYGTFTLAQTMEVRYGDGSQWKTQVMAAGTHSCDNATFGGDPAFNVVKHCEARPTTQTPPPTSSSVYPGATRYPSAVAP